MTLLALFASLASAAPNQTAVRATFGDGQVLMGEVRTRTLNLATGSGVIDIPLEDVGEVVPVDGEGLAEARGQVTVWLRNGSELRGTWNDPTLEMRVAVGGNDVTVDLPMNDLFRFQLQGGTRWSNGPLYRLRTAFGDDFLVDPKRTTVALQNEFGVFEPKLSECTHIAPVDEPDGPWRIELETGTVLLGDLMDERLTVALPMGPEEVSVPLANFVSLSADGWGQPGPVYSQTYEIEVNGSPSYASAAPRRRSRNRGAPSVESAPPSDWFDHAPLEASKAQ